MAKKKERKYKALIVVESPNKISSVSKYAGPEYLVKASVGHIRELGGGGNKMGVDFRNQYEPTFSIIDGKASVIAELKNAAKECEMALIATDADREGEAIGWHVAEHLTKDVPIIKRMSFTEITKSAIQEALKEKNLREINMPLVHAQIARQILDKIIGFKVSPVLWTALRSGLSAGRVQSVALRLIRDREAEILKFIPEDYWYLDGHFKTKKTESIQARLVTKDKDNKIWKETDLTKVLQDLEGAKYKIHSVNSKETSRSPNGPFSTSTLQQTASSQFGWTPKKTMEVAQKLYEGHGDGGLITYHRTDSFTISTEASALAKVYINRKFGDEYSPKVTPDYAKKQKEKKKKKEKKGEAAGGVQFESHEAIRPTDINRESNVIVDPDQKKLYELIWRRFVASQMENAKFDQATIEIGAKKHIFRCTGSRLLFDGFLKVWTYSKNEDTILPSVKEGEEVNLDKLDPSKHQTKPPDRYTPSSLVKLLEGEGIGRPSTYANIIDTLQKREYVDYKGKSFTPTELGCQVCDHLLKCEFEFMDPQFTALVERALDEIAQGELERASVIDLFWNELRKDIKGAREIQDEMEKTDFDCPKCKRKLLLKTNRKGQEFYGCSGYSDKENKCTHIMNKGENGDPEEIVIKKTGKACPKCGGNIVKRSGRFGDFFGCDNYPACKTIVDSEGKVKEKKKPKPTGIKCTKCGAEMAVRTNRKTGEEFYGCTNYPKCKNIQKKEPKK